MPSPDFSEVWNGRRNKFRFYPSVEVRISRFLWSFFLCVLVAVGFQSTLTHRVLAPEDIPWTPLDLSAPLGLFTGHKIGDLADKPDACAGLLRQAAIPFEPVSAHREGEFCGWSHAVRMRSTEQIPRPTDTLTCPMAAGVHLWIDRVVQPAAIEIFGTRVNRVESMGSYSCRRIYGRSAGVWSQHAEANAVDVGAFRLSDGRRVIVARDWQSGARGKFLHEVRDGACRLFATTLSPDYNAAHYNHLHLDLARRGSVEWAMCK